MTPQQFKRIRTALGLTQEGLAKELGLDVTTVSRYERGLLEISVLVDLSMTYLKINHAAKNETLGM